MPFGEEVYLLIDVENVLTEREKVELREADLRTRATLSDAAPIADVACSPPGRRVALVLAEPVRAVPAARLAAVAALPQELLGEDDVRSFAVEVLAFDELAFSSVHRSSFRLRACSAAPACCSSRKR